MKPVNIYQLLFHPKIDSLSFFLLPFMDLKQQSEINLFFEKIETELVASEKLSLKNLLQNNYQVIKRIMKDHPHKSCGFFISQDLQGYMILLNKTDFYHVIGQSFYFRPVLEEFFVNPEYILVNVSLYDIKIYRGDFQYIEIYELFEFDQIPKHIGMPEIRAFAPQYLGPIPYKTILALKSVSQKIKDMILYESVPVILTGLDVMKSQFLRFFDDPSSLITQFSDDFFEKDIREISDRCRAFRPAVTDYYSRQLKERLRRMTSSKLILTDLKDIIKATFDGKVTHLVLPPELKIWGTMDKKTGEFLLHKKMLKTSVDLLSELAEEIVKQGGGLKILQPHFFPEDVVALAILRGPL